MEPINLTTEQIDKMLENFKTQLMQNRHNGMTFTFKPTATKAPDPIIVNFTGLAWLKMNTLVSECYNEIGWQGTVIASDDRKYFSITDILIYPQAVTGGNVTVDETKYEPWHQTLNDEQYNTLRFQGHSHVNFACSPSSVDQTLYDAMLQTISDTSYYIFMIVNKKGDTWTKIYDLANNVIYDKDDIKITLEDTDLRAWYKTNYDSYIALKTYSSGYTAPATKEDKKKLKQSTPTTSDSVNELPLSTTQNLLDDLDLIKLTKDEQELINAFLCDPHYSSDDPHVCAQIQGILARVEKAKEKQNKQKGKQDKQHKPKKPVAPIDCVGCTTYRWFNPDHIPCKYCEIVLENKY